MGFRCHRCGKAQPAHARPVVVVTGTRHKEYRETRRDEAGNEFQVTTGHGIEISGEARLCAACARADEGAQ